MVNSIVICSGASIFKYCTKVLSFLNNATMVHNFWEQQCASVHQYLSSAPTNILLKDNPTMVHHVLEQQCASMRQYLSSALTNIFF
jgi:hypothetical protein